MTIHPAIQPVRSATSDPSRRSGNINYCEQVMLIKFARPLFVLISVLVAGCIPLQPQVSIRNQTSEVVEIESMHTEQSRKLESGEEGIIRHGSGTLVVHTKSGKSIAYEDIAIDKLWPYVHDRPYIVQLIRRKREYTLRLELSPDWKLYVLPPKAKRRKEKIEQPGGWPKAGVEVHSASRSCPSQSDEVRAP